MTDEPIDLQAAIREAAQRISAEARAAIDLYVLEQGPLRLEREGDGFKFVALENVRLRIKEAAEIRAEERAKTLSDVLVALEQMPYPPGGLLKLDFLNLLIGLKGGA